MDRTPQIPTRQLSDPPEVSHLRRQAKRLMKTFTANDPGAISEVERFCPGQTASTFTLSTAQLVIARAHGFDTWRAIIWEVERRHPTVVAFVKAVRTGNAHVAKRLLNESQLLRLRINDPWFEGQDNALSVAESLENKDIVDLLLEAGATPNPSTGGN